MNNNPAYSTRVELIERTLAGNATLQSSTFGLFTYARIVGTVKTDKACTVTVYQGPATDQLDMKESFTTAADFDLGAGSGYSHYVRAPEGYGQVRVTNNSSESCQVRLLIALTRAPI